MKRRSKYVSYHPGWRSKRFYW